MNCNGLNGFGWSELLRDRPQFAEHCEWDKLDGLDWGWLIRKQPQFAEYCAWDKLSGRDWRSVLSKQPNILNDLPHDDKQRAVMLSKHALQYITDPSDKLIMLHKVKHEL